jgi:hypothetical protein
MTDVYVSADIEADGPIPGVYSMLALGFAVAATFDGVAFRPARTRASRRSTASFAPSPRSSCPAP